MRTRSGSYGRYNLLNGLSKLLNIHATRATIEPMKNYKRQPTYDALIRVLHGSPNLIQVIIGARQVGKTTLALQILKSWQGPCLYETADRPNTPSADWIEERWEKVRALVSGRQRVLLVLDEVQKIPQWSQKVKALFDEDKRTGKTVRVIILGSSALLMQRGLTESLAGRFELHHLNQWSFRECRECFRVSLDKYLFFGGYPSALSLRKDVGRWARYVRDSLIETVLSKDLLLLSPIAKPVLLRQAFGFAMNHPAEIVSYQKMLGSLQDAGNTTTIASYLQLLAKAFLLAPLERWGGSRIRQRGSIPKIIVLDNGLIHAMQNALPGPTLKDPALRGRLVENAVGAQLYFLVQKTGGELFYWRDRDDELDYVIKIGPRVIAIEVKSGNSVGCPKTFEIFRKKYPRSECILLTKARVHNSRSFKQMALEEFFKNPDCLVE